MRSGFSLVELSIVLVILGLLTGGILAGQNLIRAAELRSVMTDMQRYQTAIMTFREKYFAMPGDMANATAFWGAEDANVVTCGVTPSDGPETCDGDGNGQITWGNQSYELFRAWQHLANAGLIEGSYEGTAGAQGASDADVGRNVPSSKMGTAGFTIRHFTASDFSSNVNYFNIAYTGHTIIFGDNPDPSCNCVTYIPILMPEEAWNIDKKFDDGRPGIGNVFTMNNTFNASCVSDDDFNAAEYVLSDTSKACSIFYKF